MTEFSDVIDDFWHPKRPAIDVICQDGKLLVVINPDLPEDRRVTIVTAADGLVTVSLTPAMADSLGVSSDQALTESALRQALADADVDMYEGDLLFYFTAEAKSALLTESPTGTVRRLNEGDAALFTEFESSASEEDLDDAYVELDHWAVFGSFEGGRLVAAASSYPWRGSRLADIGVLTLPEFRGKGHGRAAVRTLARHAYDEGYEPQYRCQLDNHASRGLAASAGLTLFGKWEVVLPASSD